MTPALLLVHGWGFDADFWKPLMAELPGRRIVAWDLGFLGRPSRPALPPDVPVVAVGHSFGLLWLAHQTEQSWQATISINGFTRFAAGGDFPAGVPPRLIERMAVRLNQAPAAVYGDFMARFGAVATGDESLDQARLAEGLEGLARWDCRGMPPALALAGRNDPLLSAEMTAHCFAEPSVVWHDGGHLLPREDPRWCAEQIGAFCDHWDKQADLRPPENR